MNMAYLEAQFLIAMIVTRFDLKVKGNATRAPSVCLSVSVSVCVCVCLSVSVSVCALSCCNFHHLLLSNATTPSARLSQRQTTTPPDQSFDYQVTLTMPMKDGLHVTATPRL